MVYTDSAQCVERSNAESAAKLAAVVVLLTKNTTNSRHIAHVKFRTAWVQYPVLGKHRVWGLGWTRLENKEYQARCVQRRRESSCISTRSRTFFIMHVA